MGGPNGLVSRCFGKTTRREFIQVLWRPINYGQSRYAFIVTMGRYHYTDGSVRRYQFRTVRNRWRISTSVTFTETIRDGEPGRDIIYISLHCHHQNDSSIKMGSDERDFNVLLFVFV